VIHVTTFDKSIDKQQNLVLVTSQNGAGAFVGELLTAGRFSSGRDVRERRKAAVIAPYERAAAKRVVSRRS
jgi:hypothetical protein